jgi:hypothetical protein
MKFLSRKTMSKNEQNFIPEITINNTKTTKTVDIDGVSQEVEVPAQEGFNIKTKDLAGDYDKQFFLKDLKGVILFDRYQIQSKYSTKPMYMSNEFEFSGKRNNVRVYCPEEKRVLYEGPYAGAKEHFATGKKTSAGTAEKTFDVFSILYVLISGEVFRFRWKMNQNNNWFSYKDGCNSDETERDAKGYRKFITKFNLEKKKFGTNEFWACNLMNIGKADDKESNKIGDELEKKLDEIEEKFNKPKSTEEVQTDDIQVDDIPF